MGSFPSFLEAAELVLSAAPQLSGEVLAMAPSQKLLSVVRTLGRG